MFFSVSPTLRRPFPTASSTWPASCWASPSLRIRSSLFSSPTDSLIFPVTWSTFPRTSSLFHMQPPLRVDRKKKCTTRAPLLDELDRQKIVAEFFADEVVVRHREVPAEPPRLAPR